MLDIFALEQLRQIFGAFHRGSTHQDGLAGSNVFGDVFHNRRELCFLRFVDAVGVIHTLVWFVRRDRNDVQFINRVQLGGFGLCSTGHTGDLVVQTEVVLQRNRRQGLVFVFDLDFFFCLDRLVHAFAEPATSQDTAGEAVDDHDFAFADNVVLVAHK